MNRAAFLGALYALLTVTSACTDGPESGAPAVGGEPPERRFAAITAESRLEFTHHNGRAGAFYFVEPVGAGLALFDYDGDGDLDVLLVQGGPLGAEPSGNHPLTRLFRNDGERDGSLRFVDVTEASGLAAAGYGMGVAVGDFDDDGCPDLYLTFFGPDQLWRNRCDGSFEEVSAAAGVADSRWTTSAVFVDYDGDGFLDLFVTSYVDFTLAGHRQCHSPAGRPDYCTPHAYAPLPDRLWRNRGDGTFEDVSAPAGIAGHRGAGLGVTTADFDGDGHPDLYVANDQMANFLWRNRGDGSFEERAWLAGVAVDLRGMAQASMGVEAGDLANHGREDLFMTHLTGETNTYYLNTGGGVFEDRSAPSLLGAPSLRWTGFGTALLDFDQDGWLDLAVANGAVTTIEALAVAGDPFPLHQPNQLFRNRGDGTFEEVTGPTAAPFQRSEVSRGMAAGDLDHDGAPDLVLTNNGGPARVLHNQNAGERAWLGARLLLRPGGRDALGARAAVHRSRGPTLWRRARADGSYLSAQDPRVLFGLGTREDEATVERLEVWWPGGRRQTIVSPPLGRYLVLAQPPAAGIDALSRRPPIGTDER
jgi:enediyne biosynthesis protein E4